MRENSCCFAGNRTDKMPSSIQNNEIAHAALLLSLQRAILDAIAQGYLHFYCGMCEGFDLWAAQAVLQLQEENAIQLHAVIPFWGQEKSWTPAWKTSYQDILNRANEVIVLAEHYHPDCYFARNRYMVEHSSLLLCYHTNKKGGTAYTVRYAKKNGLIIHNLADEQCYFF